MTDKQQAAAVEEALAGFEVWYRVPTKGPDTDDGYADYAVVLNDDVCFGLGKDKRVWYGGPTGAIKGSILLPKGFWHGRYKRIAYSSSEHDWLVEGAKRLTQNL